MIMLHIYTYIHIVCWPKVYSCFVCLFLFVCLFVCVCVSTLLLAYCRVHCVSLAIWLPYDNKLTYLLTYDNTLCRQLTYR